jgi:shikimate dehydrogenase
MAEPIRAFVVGYPAKHSRSPLIHRYWLDLAGIRGSYEIIEVPPGDFTAFVATLRDGSGGYAGGNVTIPHKEAAFALADRTDAIAEELHAANTLWLENGRLLATNTDGYGFSANLDDRAPGWDSAPSAVVLGAGGASRAVIQTLRDRGVKQIDIVNRTVSRAEELARRFGPRISAHPMQALDKVMAGASLFVNTTSLGMGGTPVPEIDFRRLADGAIVTDAVYAPLVTPLLAVARQQGLKTVDGLGMLLHQAVPGFEKWFGIRPVVTEELRSLVVRDLEGGP